MRCVGPVVRRGTRPRSMLALVMVLYGTGMSCAGPVHGYMNDHTNRHTSRRYTTNI